MKKAKRKLVATVASLAILVTSLYAGPLFLKTEATVPDFVSLSDIASTYIESSSSALTEQSTLSYEPLNSFDDVLGITVSENDPNSYNISTAEGLVALARYSQTHSTDEKVFTINTLNSFSLGSDFIGIGSSKFPFKGTLLSSYNITISLDGCPALFRYLSSSAVLFPATASSQTVTLNVGSVTPTYGGLAQTLVVAAGSTAMTLSSRLVIDGFTLDENGNRTNMKGTVVNTLPSAEDMCDTGVIFGKIDTQMDFSLTVNSSVSNIKKVTAGIAGNAGALIGSISGNVTLSFTNVSIYNDLNGDSVEVEAKNGSAGGLFGKIAGNVSVTINDTELSLDGVTAHGGNAGGVLGELATNAVFTVNNALTVDTDSKAITAYLYSSNGGNAGGIVGLLSTGSHVYADSLSVDSTNGIGVYGGTTAGGVFGKIDHASVTTVDGAQVSQIYSNNTTVAGNGYNGGYAGQWLLSDNYTLNARVKVYTVTLYPVGNNRCGCGGLVGNVTSLGADFTLSCTDYTDPVYVLFNTEKITFSAWSLALGGLFGEVQNQKNKTFLVSGKGESNAIVDASTACDSSSVGAAGGVIGRVYNDNNNYSYVELSNLYAISSFTGFSTTKATSAGGIGMLMDGTTLYAHGCYINHKKKAVNNLTNAVFIGYTGKGTVVRLGGVLKYVSAETNHFEAVVKQQDCSLIYAENNSFAISRHGKILGDDIGSYGQIIRNENLSSIISMDANTHDVSISKLNGATATAVSLGGNVDFARLALTLSSHGYFSAIDDIDTSNYQTLLSSSTVISLTSDIDLAETGIESLTQSCNAEGDVNVTVNGNNHKITLDIGAMYPDEKTATDTSYPRLIGVFTHNIGTVAAKTYLGLFSSCQNAKFNNLTVDGNIVAKRFDTGYSDDEKRRVEHQDDTSVYAGALCGYVNGELDVINCTTDINMTVIKESKAESYFGGFVGWINANNNQKFTSCTSTAEISFNNSSIVNNTPIIGGFIGSVNGANGKTITIQSCTANAVITSSETVGSKNDVGVRVGGIIGIVANSSSSRTTVVLSQSTVGGSIRLYVAEQEGFGGLIGFHWTNVNVTLSNTSINGTVENRNAATESLAGGLFYQVDGKMTVDGATVDVKGTYTSTATVGSNGLFVCNGSELYFVLNSAETFATDVLTANTTDHSLTVSGGEYFDYLVGNNITARGSNNAPTKGGLVSLETGAGTGKLPASGSKWYTFTANMNANTRYYGNIDALIQRTSLGSQISSPQDLILWHLTHYANNDKTSDKVYNGYMTELNSLTTYTTISLSNNLDLTEYCYYPTSVSSLEMNMGNNTVTFVLPTETVRLNAVSDPAFQMGYVQSGFLQDVGSLSVSDGTFAGEVNHWTNGSGVLVMGTLSGKATKPVSTANLSLQNLTLNRVKIHGAASNDYAPVLINRINTYVEAYIRGISQSNYVAGDIAGSSLIGTAGSDTAQNLKFLFEQIDLDGEKVDVDEDGKTSPFTKASLFDYIKYVVGTSSFNYNFNLEEDWNVTHINEVTYGKELYEKNTEYYNNSAFVSPNSSTATSVYTGFNTEYIPYVRDGYQISVNIKSGDMIEGWGTYANPYIIESARQLYAVYNLIMDDNNHGANPNWQVNYPYLSSGAYDYSRSATYKVNSDFTVSKIDAAVAVDTITLYMIRVWFQEAYFVIDADAIDLSGTDFSGIGTPTFPFHGVIIGNGRTETTITMPAKTSADQLSNWGLIGTADGCVVKDLTVNYDASSRYTVAYGTSSGATITSDVNDSYVGGVIAQIVGGDNIIDCVGISNLTSTNLVVTNAVSYVGGMVGCVLGGGLIFRNMAGVDGLTDFAGISFQNWYYTNPYVGRVIDGYVIDQTGATVSGNTVSSVDNTDKNYTIPYLPDNIQIDVNIEKVMSGSAVTDCNTTFTIDNANELFVLSSALNSGSLSMELSGIYRASNGRRSRHGYYDSVGSDTAITSRISDDWVLLTHSNYPYLVALFKNNDVYATNITTTSTARRSDVSIVLAENGSYDMTTFGNGFRGIGGVYTNSSRFYLAMFDGNGSTVTLNMNRKEYLYSHKSGTTYTETKEANFSTGIGLFNSLLIGSNSNTFTMRDVVISGVVSLRVAKFDLYAATAAAKVTLLEKSVNGGEAVAAAGLVGSTIMTAQHDNNYRYENIRLNRLSVDSQDVSGGIVGYQYDSDHNTAAGAVQQTVFDSCSYSYIKINAETKAGGLLGYARSRNISFTNTQNKICENGVITIYHPSSVTGGTLGSKDKTRHNDIATGGIVGFCYGNRDNPYYYLYVDGMIAKNLTVMSMCDKSATNNIQGSGGIIGRADWISIAVTNTVVTNPMVLSGCGSTYGATMTDAEYTLPSNILSKIPTFDSYFDDVMFGSLSLGEAFTEYYRYTVGRLNSNFDAQNKVKYCDGSAGGVIGGYGSNILDVYTSRHMLMVDNCEVRTTQSGLSTIIGYNDAGGLVGEMRANGTNQDSDNPFNDVFDTLYSRSTHNLEIRNSKFNVSVTGTETATGPAVVIGGTRAGGLCGFGKYKSGSTVCKFKYSVTADASGQPVTVVGNSTNTTYILAPTSGDSGMAGGIEGDSWGSSYTENCRVYRTVISGSCPGGIVGSSGSVALTGSVSVNNSIVDECLILCFPKVALQSNPALGTDVHSSTPGGMIGCVANLSIFLNGCTVKNSRIERCYNKNGNNEIVGYAGGFVGMAQAKETQQFSANKLLWVNNTVGQSAVSFGKDDANGEKYTYAKLLATTFTGGTFSSIIAGDTLTGEKAGLVVGSTLNPIEVNVLGISRIDTSANPIAYPVLCNNPKNSTVRTVFADYCAEPDETDAAANLIFDRPSYTLDSITLVGDSFGNDKYLTGANAGTTAKTPLVLQSLSTNLWTDKFDETVYPLSGLLKNYSQYNASAPDEIRNLPLLALSGDSNTVVEDYINLLTNGGFAAWKGRADVLSATSTLYSVATDGTVTPQNGQQGSVVPIYDQNGILTGFAKGSQYDQINSETASTFTVLSVTYTNADAKDSTTSYRMDIPIYYEQVLQVYTYVSPKGFETYKISPFITEHPDATDINADGTFTAYIEYAFSKQRAENVDWNFEKSIQCRDINGSYSNPDAGEVRIFPSGTRMTLIDLNSADSSGYFAYHLVLNADKHEVLLSEFTRPTDDGDVSVEYLPMADLPYGAAGYSIKTPNTAVSEPESADYWGVERYMLVVDLPANEPVNANADAVYHLFADVADSLDTHNVTLQRHRTKGAVTVWSNTQVSVGTLATGKTTLSTNSAVEAVIKPTVTYPTVPRDYRQVIQSVRPDLVHYGIIRYYIEDSADRIISLPADTRITITGQNGISDSTVIQSSLSVGNYVLPDNMLVTPANGGNYTVQLDFSNVEGNTFNDAFADDSHRLFLEFYLAENRDYPESGIKQSLAPIPLTKEQADTSILGVNVTSNLLYLGVNQHTSAETDSPNTNNGHIAFNIAANIEDFDGLTNASIQFRLYQKSSGGTYPLTPISVANFSNYATSFTPVDSPVADYSAQSMTLNVTSDLEDDGSIDRNFVLQVNTAVTEYANYMLEAVLTYTDSGGNVKTGTGHFVYTLAKIQTEIVD